MNRRICGNAFLAACACILLTGCMPKMTIDELKQMMPERPAQLDLLNDFVGKWEGTGEMTFAGLDEVLTSSSTSEIKWEGDDWYLVERADMHMDEFGDMTGMATWTYDINAKLFRNTWVDSMGSLGTGEGWYDEKNDSWRMRAISHGPMGKSTMKGTVKFIDDNTMEWWWAEYAMGGLVKVMELNGTGRRK